MNEWGRSDREIMDQFGEPKLSTKDWPWNKKPSEILLQMYEDTGVRGLPHCCVGTTCPCFLVKIARVLEQYGR